MRLSLLILKLQKLHACHFSRKTVVLYFQYYTYIIGDIDVAVHLSMCFLSRTALQS